MAWCSALSKIGVALAINKSEHVNTFLFIVIHPGGMSPEPVIAYTSYRSMLRP